MASELKSQSTETMNLDDAEVAEDRSGNHHNMKNAEDNDCDDDSDSSTPLCPLFMDTLPSNFDSNPGLAAIASLLDEDDDEQEDKLEKEKPIHSRFAISTTAAAAGPAGGGKASNHRRHSRTRRMGSAPYPSLIKNDKPKEKKQATLGQAQVFLQLWKI